MRCTIACLALSALFACGHSDAIVKVPPQTLPAASIDDIGRRIAASSVRGVLATLKVYRAAMREVQEDVYSRYPEERSRRRKLLIAEYGPHLDRISKDLSRSLVSSVETTREKLASCSAQSVKQCAYEFGREALLRAHMQAMEGATVDPSLVIIADDQLTGLTEVSRKYYAYDTGFSKVFSGSHEVRYRRAVWRGNVAVDIPSIGGRFAVAIHPVLNASGTFIGVVAVGVRTGPRPSPRPRPER